MSAEKKPIVQKKWQPKNPGKINKDSFIVLDNL